MSAPGGPTPPPPMPFLRQATIWVAQGFGLGRLPLAPGTWGSVLGLLCGLALLRLGGIWWLATAAVAALVLAVPVCGAAEDALDRRDPPSVVLDEIAAMPWCLGGWLAPFVDCGATLDPGNAWSGLTPWLLSAGAFVAFRFFDIAKPWPVNALQKIPGGWGIVLDDLMAAIYSALVGLPVAIWLR